MAATAVKTTDERYDSLPVYNASAAPWSRGARLLGVVTSETTAPDILVPESVAVKPGVGQATPFVRGRDYEMDLQWGTFGRLPGGIRENTPVLVDYEIGLHRIDTVAVDAEGRVTIWPGQPHNATPKPPSLPSGAVAIANLWIPARLKALAPDSLFPITEPTYRPPSRPVAPASRLLPRTWDKLTSGGRLHVLAWGDSVTAGGEASSVEKRWQNRFVAMLGSRFPKATIKLTTAGWGGRNSDSFLKEPPGAEFNFDRAVIGPRPDVVVMEFVNDGGFTPAMVEEKYGYLLKRFKDAGIEWAILTPHLVWPPWMGQTSARIEEDPRPYVAGVRAFAKKHGVALADASLRYCHLVKEGIPYITLMVNSLNHPDDRGHEMFALSLMELFTMTGE
jgi:lysophospholipase L1-like esterase